MAYPAITILGKIAVDYGVWGPREFFHRSPRAHYPQARQRHRRRDGNSRWKARGRHGKGRTGRTIIH
jgi:hypothetical protein